MLTVGELVRRHVPVDFERMHVDDAPKRILLPSFPFKGKHFLLPTPGPDQVPRLGVAPQAALPRSPAGCGSTGPYGVLRFRRKRRTLTAIGSWWAIAPYAERSPRS
ncbi:hypothetical protein [Alkalilimnicola ehrlichii]|uniref:hypothetical protein n=1 Tax=Alkalilimnicola ehrlichii TaxID=351052 RepID=UPI0011C08011|nr:hypothetical protein [Alkalilimnicola ehrlichii]